MAQLNIYASGFRLTSEYVCVRQTRTEYSKEGYYGGASLVYERAEAASVAIKGISFSLSELPAGAKITKARVYATLGSSLYGAKVSTINGVHVNAGATIGVNVPVLNSSYVYVEFIFQSNSEFHVHYASHDDVTVAERIREYNDGSYTVFHTVTKQHSGTLGYDNVYLQVEYEDEGGDAGGYIHRAEGGELVPYQLCRAEGGELVPYQLCKAEGGELVPY